MSGLIYTVKREGSKVFYTIYRGEDAISRKEVEWFNLGFFNAIFRCSRGSEKSITLQLKLANKLAKHAISSMEKYEK